MGMGESWEVWGQSPKSKDFGQRHKNCVQFNILWSKISHLSPLLPLLTAYKMFCSFVKKVLSNVLQQCKKRAQISRHIF